MKRLLSTLSEKWPEYIMESIVIVASILGAIALENWNDDRKEKEHLKEIYQVILSDLEKDVEIIDTLYTHFHWRSEVIEGALKLPFNSKRWSASDSLWISISGYPDFAISKNGIQLLRNHITIGNKSGDLATQLTQFYDHIDLRSTVANQNLIDTFSENLNCWNDRYPSFASARLNGEMDKFIKEISNDEFFRNRLYTYSVVVKNYEEYIDEYHESSMEYIEKLKQQ